MQVHNLMEEIVSRHVNEFYNNLKSNQTWISCDCENCRADTICYVLNKIPARYVLSGRGITHLWSDIDDSQLKADLNALSLEGIRTVSATKRPFHSEKKITKKEVALTKPAFNFPIFQGLVIDGSTFEPINNATITLKLDGKPVKMRDESWTNPTKTFKSTKGTYSFWVNPIETKQTDKTKTFNFVLEAEAEGYTPIIYAFELNSSSETADRSQINSTYSIKIQDLFLFREEIENPME